MNDLFDAAAENERGHGGVLRVEAGGSSSSVGGLDGIASEPGDEVLTPSLPQDIVLQKGVGSADSYEE